jgi:hypothetical protein
VCIYRAIKCVVRARARTFINWVVNYVTTSLIALSQGDAALIPAAHTSAVSCFQIHLSESNPRVRVGVGGAAAAAITNGFASIINIIHHCSNLFQPVAIIQAGSALLHFAGAPPSVPRRISGYLITHGWLFS